MKLYLSGGISYNPERAGVLFAEGERCLKPFFEVFNPFTFCSQHGIVEWKGCMALLLPELLYCDGVAVVDWHNASVGRDIELFIAEKMLIPIKTVADWRKDCERFR